MQRKHLGAALGAGLVLIVILLIRPARRVTAPGEPRASNNPDLVLPVVHTIRVAPSLHFETVEVTGTVKASLMADVASKVMSKVVAVYPREGQSVAAGQILVRLESGDLEAQKRQATAAVAGARAGLSQGETGVVIQQTQSRTRVSQAMATLRQAQEQSSIVREGARQQQKLQADQVVLRAQAAHAQAAAGVQEAAATLRQSEEQASIVTEGARQQQKLQADQAVLRAQAGQGQAVAAAQEAGAGLAAARAQLELVREGSRQQQKLQGQAAVQQARAGLKTAQTTYDRYKPLADQGVITQQRLDEIALQLEIARGQYETAQQQASMIAEGARPQEVRQAEAAVLQAQGGLTLAQNKIAESAAAVHEAEQQRELTYVGARPQEVRQAVDQVRLAQAALRGATQKARAAQAGVREAQAQRDLTYAGARPQEVRQANDQVRQATAALRLAVASTDENKIKADTVLMLRAQLAQAEANLSSANAQLSYTTIRAPFAGIVVHRSVDPGAMATPGAPLLTIVDPSGYHLATMLPESRLSGIHLGEPAQVNIDALHRQLSGVIAQIVPNADPASRTIVVKVALPRVAGLAPGLFGRMSYATNMTRSLFVPATAIWREESLAGVLTVKGGVARRRLLTIGKTEGQNVQVLAGLNAGETIVTRNVERIADGTTVRVAPPGEAPKKSL